MTGRPTGNRGSGCLPAEGTEGNDASPSHEAQLNEAAQARREVRRKSMDLLARREHSRYELRLKLVRRHYDNQLIDEVLAGLVAEQLCSDERFTTAFIHSRIQRGHGPVKIRADLRHRGVDDELVAESLTRTDEIWVACARAVLRRRFGCALPAGGSDGPIGAPVGGLTGGLMGGLAGASLGPKEEARQRRFLAGRGFTHAQIRAAVRAVE